MPSFINVGYVRQILGRRGVFLASPIREQPRKGPSWIGLSQQICQCAHLFLCNPQLCPKYLSSKIAVCWIYESSVHASFTPHKVHYHNHHSAVTFCITVCISVITFLKMYLKIVFFALLVFLGLFLSSHLHMLQLSTKHKLDIKDIKIHPDTFKKILII